MRRINEYKKLFNVDGPIVLSDLKQTYRGLVKQWHPDKFREGDEQLAEAEAKSQEVIEAYEFLVSIAPETMAKQKEEYEAMLAKVQMVDYNYKGQRLEVEFTNGATYEYYGVSKSQYNKLNASPIPMRFARRNIFSTTTYRKSKRELKASANQ